MAGSWESPTCDGWESPTGSPCSGGGGGGTTTVYVYLPWTVEEPWTASYFGDDYETGANANFFAPNPACTSSTF
jgi:hypothetical protein